MLVNNEFLNWFRDAWQLFFQQYKGYLKTAVNYKHKKLVVILEVDIANDLFLIQYQPCTTVVLLGRTYNSPNTVQANTTLPTWQRKTRQTATFDEGKNALARKTRFRAQCRA